MTPRHPRAQTLTGAPELPADAGPAATRCATTALDDGGFVVTLSGEVDLVTDAELDNVVDLYRASTAARATVDLHAVTFMDTAGLTFLSNLREIALGRGGRVTLTGAHGVSLRTLEVVRFHTLFDMTV